MIIRIVTAIIFITVMLTNAFGQSVTDVVRTYRSDHEKDIIDEYMTLLKMPNIPSTPSDLDKNAAHIRSMMEKRGIKTSLLELPDVPPVIYGELISPGATNTMMFYAHYDGQPVNPALWSSSPFEPVFRTDFPYRGGKDIAYSDLTYPLDPTIRIFSRSAADDRAPIISMLIALEAMKKAGISPSMNIKFFIEGEEERGSPHVPEFIEKYKDRLEADLWLFCDSPQHQSDKKTLVFGVRGGFSMSVTVYGAARPLHSGHYGNFSPNPNVELAYLITSMRDEDANILIDGFYDQVIMPTKEELDIINGQANNDEALKYDLGIKRQESPGKRYEESIMLPGLNIRRIETSAETGGVIPTSASMQIRVRTVPDMDADVIADRLLRHIEKQGYFIVDKDPDVDTLRSHEKVAKVSWSGSYKAIRTSTATPVSKALIKIIRDYTNGDMIVLPTMGGSMPLSYIDNALDTNIVILPIANFDNNQHAPNENIKIGHLWDGMEIFANIFTKLGPDL
ncbi:MAG: M20/M25/M40 family metallo-hydrolase [Alphaproteobacteria bacterium]|nr:M20/M25/M40 family metallo-hydrolase [Alphaproteobacteria bacterium]HRW29049.1 M20/M25/M40 family metallo-hydrolase [Emcibacteraceae bacterium]